VPKGGEGLWQLERVTEEDSRLPVVDGVALLPSLPCFGEVGELCKGATIATCDVVMFVFLYFARVSLYLVALVNWLPLSEKAGSVLI